MAMAEPVIEHYHHTEDSNSSSMGFFFGIVLLAIIIFLFFYYAVPYLRNSITPQVNVPGQIDLNVSQK